MIMINNQVRLIQYDQNRFQAKTLKISLRTHHHSSLNQVYLTYYQDEIFKGGFPRSWRRYIDV